MPQASHDISSLRIAPQFINQSHISNSNISSPQTCLIFRLNQSMSRRMEVNTRPASLAYPAWLMYPAIDLVSALQNSSLFEKHPEYRRALSVVAVPERVIQFRVVWEDVRPSARSVAI